MTQPSSHLAPPTESGNAYLDLISQISGLILEETDLSSMLDRVCGVIQDVLGLERASILLLDPGTQLLSMRAARGIPAEIWPDITIPLGEGIAGRVAKEGVPLMASDIAQTDLPAGDHGEYRDNSFISAPLKIRGRVLGVLNVNNQRDGSLLDEGKLQLVLAVASMVAMGVENSTLLSGARTLQRHFRGVLGEMSQGVICTDRFATITLCNRVAARIIGVQGEEVIGHEIHLVLPCEIRKEIDKMMDECLEKRKPAIREVVVATGPGQPDIPVRVTLATLRNHEDLVKVVMLVMEDLSLNKEVEELRRLEELQSNFLAMVSHELRTPLTSIKGSVHLLASGAVEGSPTQRQSLYDLLSKNTERLIVQINNILDVNQLEHRTMNLFPKSFNLAATVRKCADNIRPEFEDKGVELRVNTPETLEITGDHERIFQVISHSLDNAQKFTPSGGQVTIDLCADDPWAHITIRDSGIGLPQEFRDKVFAKFFQVEHTLTRKAGGNGLGLFIANGLVELHGGEMKFLDCAAPGAKLKITLPLQTTATGPEHNEVL